MGNDVSGMPYYHEQFGAFAAQQTQGNSARNGPPPASSRLLAKLSPINITADDLLEVTNKECVVCLGEQLIGDPAAKLPCGHLFHVGCIQQWLERHCTCPVCRYELETDDSEYERSRKSRMQQRKQRYRLDELQKKPISVLKDIMNQFSISSAGCVDKRDLIDRLIGSDKIEIVEGAPAAEFSYSELHKKGIPELREIMLSYGISHEGALEKRDLIDRLVNSGRVVVVASTVQEEVLGCDDYSSVTYETKESSAYLDRAENAHKKNTKTDLEGSVEDRTSNEPDFVFTAEDNSGPRIKGQLIDERIEEHAAIRTQLMKKGIRELCGILDSLGISSNGAVEKEELVKRIIESGRYSELFVGTPESLSVGKNASEPYGAQMKPKPNDYPANAQSYADGVSSFGLMSVKELRSVCSALGVNIVGCLDKSDIYDRLKAGGHISER
jgi:hypothetical protein